MIERTFADYLTRNGKEIRVVRTGDTKLSKFWKNFRINEWTFSLFLFVLSLCIVAGKLYVSYGSDVRLSAIMAKNVHPSRAFSSVSDGFGLPNGRESSSLDVENLKIVGQRLMNVSREYSDAMTDAVVGITHKYVWLLRATASGAAVMAFTWFIIYKDSSIPGVNPPSPFSPRKRRYAENSRLQINYLVGMMNGVLIFIYMCL